MTTITDETLLPAASAVVDDATTGGTIEAMANGSPEKPRRNLTEAFEALSVEPFEGFSPEFNTVVTGKNQTSLVSPTNVTDFSVSQENIQTKVSPVLMFPELTLHPDLRLDLSSYCVQRVSTYSLIHDINKECSAMAQHDPLAVLVGEKDSPLVIAAQTDLPVAEFTNIVNTQDPSKILDAVIDEEQWLLSTIATRAAQEVYSVCNSDCPSTFLQAMGEKEYDNPVQLVAGHNRTQLWKPSRSWWEAKSGKNPWIEPSSHNKRWRYLWPLIHYHKFLAKCIKKLKRNAVDVKQSVSPVSVFLREEVCAVSDHLAAVSLFGSDEWMACLEVFDGWTLVSATAEKQYREFVQHLPLRSLAEPGDVESPILRSQVDENFLRAMVAQREQFRENATAITAVANNQTSTKKNMTQRVSLEHNVPEAAVLEPAPIIQNHPVFTRSPSHPSVPRHIHGVRRPRYFPPTGGWYGWDGQSYQDNASVLSELSANSYPQQTHLYDFNGSGSGMYPYVAQGHAMPGYYAAGSGFTGSEQSQSSDPYAYGPYHDPSAGWMRPFSGTGYAMPTHSVDGYYDHPMAFSPHMMAPPVVTPCTQGKDSASTSISSNPQDTNRAGHADPTVTPYKYDPDCSITQSPFWSHLDQATISMGLATPAKPPTPATPTRREENRDDDEKYQMNAGEQSAQFAATAAGPLLRQHYYSLGNYRNPGSYGTAGLDGFVPPSPATQFMMSPHAAAVSGAGFGYPYAYGFSPRVPIRSTVMTPRHLASNTIPEFGAVSPSMESNNYEKVKPVDPGNSSGDNTATAMPDHHASYAETTNI
jgi:hypothetical protein